MSSTLDDVWTFLAEGTEAEGEDYSAEEDEEEEAISRSVYYNDEEETQQRTVSTAEQQLTTDTEQHHQQYGSSEEAAEGVDYELLTGVLDQLTSESVSVKCLYVTS